MSKMGAADDPDELLASAGIVPLRPGVDGEPVPISTAAKERLLAALGGAGDEPLPPPPDTGLLRRQSCYVPEFLGRERAWGISLQLYELRSARNWGIGDFADLAEFCAVAGAAGADFVGLNPLHALFLAEPDRCSPFSPSNRLFLNPLYIAVDAVDHTATNLVDPGRLERLRRAEFVDYIDVADLKLSALRRLWQARPSGVGEAVMAAFRQQGGEPLRRHALFEALSAAMKAQGHDAGWRSWPEPYRDCDSPEVAAFAEEHADEVEFHIWLQWLADLQLRQASAAARAAGMRIGLYLDLAVGEAPDGSATWSEPSLFVPGVTVGAPPDVFSSLGQDWGLAALAPQVMARTDAARFRQMVEFAMRRGGALRLDHAMALRQLFLVPEELTPEDGAYVRYPFDMLVGGLAAASQRNRSIVIGEDLGVVPEGFRDEMREAGILSYRILYFEQDEERFLNHAAYPKLALACLSTHDLPTLLGWWDGDDIRLRLEHGLIEEDAAREQETRREIERRSLLDRLGIDPGSLDDHGLIVAAHRFVAETPCLLAVARLADLVGERQPTNLPGTAGTYPNWRRRLPVPIERLEATPLWRDVTAILAEQRNRP